MLYVCCFSHDLAPPAAVRCSDTDEDIRGTEVTTAKYYFGDRKTYTCLRGHILELGDLSRDCRSDGLFSGHPPVCVRKSVLRIPNYSYTCPAWQRDGHSMIDRYTERHRRTDTKTYTGRWRVEERERRKERERERGERDRQKRKGGQSRDS